MRQAVAQRILRQPLQVEIERRVDARAVPVVCVTPGILLGQRLADVVDEVRRLRFERRAATT